MLGIFKLDFFELSFFVCRRFWITSSKIVKGKVVFRPLRTVAQKNKKVKQGWQLIDFNVWTWERSKTFRYPNRIHRSLVIKINAWDWSPGSKPRTWGRWEVTPVSGEDDPISGYQPKTVTGLTMSPINEILGEEIKSSKGTMSELK